MLPLIYQTLRANATVLSTVATRIYRHGSAPQAVVVPYLTWFLVTGTPEDQLSGAPCSDVDTIQIDVWHNTDTGVEALAYAVRDALDVAGHSNRFVVNTRETDTKIYRIAVQVDVIRSRME
jgi:hypothetical protein